MVNRGSDRSPIASDLCLRYGHTQEDAHDEATGATAPASPATLAAVVAVAPAWRSSATSWRLTGWRSGPDRRSGHDAPARTGRGGQQTSKGVLAVVVRAGLDSLGAASVWAVAVVA